MLSPGQEELSLIDFFLRTVKFYFRYSASRHIQILVFGINRQCVLKNVEKQC